ncbi:MAG TPA: heavy metal-binding domain-containing protein, partial [Gammaproteobacteria bacterium]|nr:heavy metal-binding domain-containing protein [Gammaproteobacteria bacterium]
MIISTAESIASRPAIRTLGLVQGNTVRARHLGRDIMAGLRTLV